MLQRYKNYYENTDCLHCLSWPNFSKFPRNNHTWSNVYLLLCVNTTSVKLILSLQVQDIRNYSACFFFSYCQPGGLRFDPQPCQILNIYAVRFWRHTIHRLVNFTVGRLQVSQFHTLVDKSRVMTRCCGLGRRQRFALNSREEGRLVYERSGDNRRKFWITSLKETGVAKLFEFLKLKETDQSRFLANYSPPLPRARVKVNG